jgi:hypothetical protein
MPLLLQGSQQLARRLLGRSRQSEAVNFVVQRFRAFKVLGLVGGNSLLLALGLD